MKVYNTCVLVFLLALLPSQAIASDTVEKTFCAQAIGYTSLDDLKTDLLTNAKRLVVNELFGELIAASTAVENFVVTTDQIRTSSIGFVRIDGDINFHNGTNLAEVCVMIRAYATEQDREKFKPVKLTKRHCVTNADMTTRQLTNFGKEEVIVQALLDYDRRLEKKDRNDLLALLQRVSYLESGFIPDTETFCARAEGYIVPVEIISLLDTELSTASSKCIPPLNGLVGWWPGDGNANDILGMNNGELAGGTTFVDGKVGQAFSFDGNDDFINIPDSATLDSITSQITVDMWIKPQHNSTGKNPTSMLDNWNWIYARRDPLVSESFSVFITDSGLLGIVARTTTIPAGGTYFTSQSGVISFDQFQHVAVTGNTQTGAANAYVNGKEIALTNSINTATLNGSLFNVNQHFIGERQSSTTSEGVGGGGHYKGVIDEIEVYSVVLSQAQVQSIYNSGSAGKCKSGD